MTEAEPDVRPHVTARATVAAKPTSILALAGPQRTFEVADAIRPLLQQLTPRPVAAVAGVAIECAARGDDPPDLHLSASDVEVLTQLNASITVEIVTSIGLLDRSARSELPDIEMLFSLKGDFDPDVASAALGLQPDHAHSAAIRQTGS